MSNMTKRLLLAFTALAIIITGIVTGFYVGIYIFLIQGVIGFAKAVNYEPLDYLLLVAYIVRIASSIFIGILITHCFTSLSTNILEKSKKYSDDE